jgi:RNA-binding protein
MRCRDGTVDPYNAVVALNERQKKHLRRLGHALHPLVTLGQAGLTDGVAAELERALNDHELVKARARVADRTTRDQAFAALAARTSSTLVQQIGNVALFFRPNVTLTRIVLPD